MWVKNGQWEQSVEEIILCVTKKMKIERSDGSKRSPPNKTFVHTGMQERAKYRRTVAEREKKNEPKRHPRYLQVPEQSPPCPTFSLGTKKINGATTAYVGRKTMEKGMERKRERKEGKGDCSGKDKGKRTTRRERKTQGLK